MASLIHDGGTLGLAVNSNGASVAFVLLDADREVVGGIACDTRDAMAEVAESLVSIAFRLYQYAGREPDLTAAVERYLTGRPTAEGMDFPPIPDDRPSPRHGG